MTTQTNTDAAAIAWLKEHLAKTPVQLPYMELRFDDNKWFTLTELDGNWRIISRVEALALVEHAWRVELEERCQWMEIVRWPQGDYRVCCIMDRAEGPGPVIAVAPTLVEAEAKALEATA